MKNSYEQDTLIMNSLSYFYWKSAKDVLEDMSYNEVHILRGRLNALSLRNLVERKYIRVMNSVQHGLMYKRYKALIVVFRKVMPVYTKGVTNIQAVAEKR